MPSVQHPLERRSSLLASALTRRVNAFSSALRPPGSRPPFVKSLTPSMKTSLLNHWHLPETQAWVNSLDPQSRVELQNALSQHIQQQNLLQPKDPAIMEQASQMQANPLAASNYGATATM